MGTQLEVTQPKETGSKTEHNAHRTRDCQNKTTEAQNNTRGLDTRTGRGEGKGTLNRDQRQTWGEE